MKPNPPNSQSIGLDVGSSRIVAARSVDGKFTYESELNAFVTVPYSKLAQNLLTRDNVLHKVVGQEILITGFDAQRMAEFFHVGIRRPILRGVLNAREPHGLTVLQTIIGKLIGTAAAEGQKVSFSVPAPGIDANDGIPYHKACISQIVRELGYRATPFEEGLAVVFGELERSDFTGIGISCGSGMCNVCLAVFSMPVMSFSISRAGDYIDEQAALVTGELADRIRVEKETAFQLNGFSTDRIQNALNVYYKEMIGSLVDALWNHMASPQRLPRIDKPLPLVLSGGTSMPPGFLEYFQSSFRTSEFPLRISEIRVAADPLNSTARGALIAAMVESAAAAA
jgi:hypothetical protein